MAALTNSLALRQPTFSLTKLAAGPRSQVRSVALRPVCSLGEKTDASASGFSAGAAAVLLSLVAPSAAQALEAEQIISAFDKAELLSKQAVDAATQALDAAKSVTDQVVDAASPVVEAATPVVVQATKAAAAAVKPYASDLAGQAQKALSGSGVELAPVVDAAKTAASVAGDAFQAASPYAQSTLDTLLEQDASVLALGAGALLLLYLTVPALFSGLAYSARGYAGEYSAAQALDLLVKEDYTLIDVRTDSQRSRSGVPALPRNAKKKLVIIPVEELPNKLRSQIRNSRKVEAEIAALKITALKRINKGSRIILIDSNGDLAKSVAQSLAALGQRRTWIIKDGVDGGQGWIASQLGTEELGGSFSLAEVLLPNRVPRSGTVQVPTTKRFLLSSGSD